MKITKNESYFCSWLLWNNESTFKVSELICFYQTCEVSGQYIASGQYIDFLYQTFDFQVPSINNSEI